MGNIIIGGSLALAMIAAVYKIIKDRKSGKACSGGCGCGCSEQEKASCHKS